MSGGWVLLVEDSADDRALIAHAWRRLGMSARLVVAEDGAAALTTLSRHGRPLPEDPLVVLLDLKMPGIDGFGVLTRLRADGAGTVPPVVVLTSSDEPSDIRRSYALGANGYVVKPVGGDRLHEMVSAVGSFWTRTNRPAPRAPDDAAGF